MDEEKLQVEIAEEENPSNSADLTDDDLAASLGFMTTLSEQSMTPPEDPTDMQEDMDEEENDIVGDTDGTPAKDEAQDKEIAEIRAQLEQLLAEETDDEPREKTED